MKRLGPIFVAGFFFSTHLALLAYLNSTMLSRLASEQWISIIFTIASGLSLALLFFAPRIVRVLGNTRLAVFAGLIGAFLLVQIGLGGNSFSAIPLFILYFSLNTLTLYCLDIYIEHYSKKEATGNIRGVYLTVCNLGWIMMPFVAGTLSSMYSIYTVYLIAAIAILLMVVLLLSTQYHFKDSEYHTLSVSTLFTGLRALPEVRRIITINFLLQFFFAWMVVYIPLYLRGTLHFTLAQTGIIFTIMLLPFVIFQYPAGKIADTIRNGEKKLLIGSLIVAGFATIALMAFKSTSIITVALALFATRIGASVIEVMCDSYFFKRVSDQEVGIIGLYRTMLPLAYIVGPLLGAGLLFFVSYETLFILLGILLLCGALYATRIPNTPTQA